MQIDSFRPVTVQEWMQEVGDLLKGEQDVHVRVEEYIIAAFVARYAESAIKLESWCIDVQRLV